LLQAIRQGVPPEFLQPARLASLLLFVVLGLRVAVAREPGARRARVTALIAYVLAAHALVALAQTDDWPFSAYRMMAVDARTHDDLRSMIAFRAVDGEGREWKVDPLAWSPLWPQAVMGWYEVVWPHASPRDRESVGRFLLERAEEARRLRAAGRRVGNETILGPLAAPDMNLTHRLGGLPGAPFVALRVYRTYWRPTELAADPMRVKRSLLAEYRDR